MQSHPSTPGPTEQQRQAGAAQLVDLAQTRIPALVGGVAHLDPHTATIAAWASADDDLPLYEAAWTPIPDPDDPELQATARRWIDQALEDRDRKIADNTRAAEQHGT